MPETIVPISRFHQSRATARGDAREPRNVSPPSRTQQRGRALNQAVETGDMTKAARTLDIEPWCRASGCWRLLPAAWRASAVGATEARRAVGEARLHVAVSRADSETGDESGGARGRR